MPLILGLELFAAFLEATRICAMNLVLAIGQYQC